MKLALDTNAYVALQQGVAPALVELVRRAEVVGLPLIVLGELRFGFLHGSRFTENARILEDFLATPRVDVLPVTTETTERFAEIATQLRRDGTPIQQNDIWIAAICRQQGFTLATRDAGFRHVLGLPVIAEDEWRATNPSAGAAPRTP